TVRWPCPMIGPTSFLVDAHRVRPPLDTDCSLSYWPRTRCACPSIGVNDRGWHRHALRHWDPDLIPMTFLPLPWQDPFARTFRSRRHHQLTLVPANTGTTSRTTPRSDHRALQQRPLRCHHRRSALGDLRETIHRYSRSDVKSP